MSRDPITLYTVGHSTRALVELLRLLEAHGIRRLVDVRTVPRSRRHPHFDREPLAAALASRGIDYLHVPALGGLRVPRPDSPHQGLPEALRGFADHMETPAFEAALEDAIARAGNGRLALMCAEAVPERCHRSLIADALVARGCRVEHIVGEGAPRIHAPTPGASIEGVRVRYPSPAPRLPGIP